MEKLGLETCFLYYIPLICVSVQMLALFLSDHSIKLRGAREGQGMTRMLD